MTDQLCQPSVTSGIRRVVAMIPPSSVRSRRLFRISRLYLRKRDEVDVREIPKTEGASDPAFSPDGHWLAFAGAPLSEMWQVYLQPYPGPGPRLQVSVENGLSPAWNPNGKEIFFLQFQDEWRARMMSVSVTLGATATLDSPRQLFEFNMDQLDMVSLPSNSFAVAPDGQRFFSLQPVSTDPPPPVTQIHLIQNWLAELEAKVPSGL